MVDQFYYLVIGLVFGFLSGSGFSFALETFALVRAVKTFLKGLQVEIKKPNK